MLATKSTAQQNVESALRNAIAETVDATGIRQDLATYGLIAAIIRAMFGDPMRWATRRLCDECDAAQPTTPRPHNPEG